MRIFDYKEGERHAPAIVSVTIHFPATATLPCGIGSGGPLRQSRHEGFTLEHHLFRAGTDEVVADRTTAIAWVDYAVGKAVALPERLKEVLARDID